jgi:ATP-dependent Clp protease ATP-binding subunit ClpA
VKAAEFIEKFCDDDLVFQIETATKLAESKRQQTGLAHVAYSILDSPRVRERLSSAIADKAKAALAGLIANLPQADPTAIGTIDFLDQVTEPTLRQAKDLNATLVSPLLFLAGALTATEWRNPDSLHAQQVLRQAGVSLDNLCRAPAPGAISDWTFGSLGYGLDLTAKARSSAWSTCPLVGMQRELQRVVVELDSRNSVMLLGEPGVGKSAIVEGLAWHIAQRTRPLIPSDMDDWTIVSISRDNLLADSALQGQLEQRLQKLLSFLRTQPNVIPFFDEVHSLFDSQNETAKKVTNSLKPAMSSGEFCCIAATTDREYGRFVAGDEALTSRFSRLLLPEPTVSEANQILEAAGVSGGEKHWVRDSSFLRDF